MDGRATKKAGLVTRLFIRHLWMAYVGAPMRAAGTVAPSVREAIGREKWTEHKLGSLPLLLTIFVTVQLHLINVQ